MIARREWPQYERLCVKRSVQILCTVIGLAMKGEAVTTCSVWAGMGLPGVVNDQVGSIQHGQASAQAEVMGCEH
jgi:hypothetical protein